MSYHVLIEGKQTGPFEDDVIAAMIARGEVTATTYVWAPEMADWAVAGSVADLKDYFTDASPAMVEAPDGAPGQRLVIGRAIGTAFKAFVRQPGRVILVGFAYTVLGLIVGIPTLVFLMPLVMAMADAPGDFAMPDIGLGLVFGYALSFIGGSALLGGVNMVLLDAVRGGPMRLARLFAGVPKLIPLVLTFVISAVIFGSLSGVVAVMIFLAASGWASLLGPPLIFLLFVLYFAVFFVMDAGHGPVTAIGSSVRMVARLGWWRMVAAFLALILIYIVLSLAIGIIVAVLGMIGLAGLPDLAMLGDDVFGGLLSSPGLVAVFAIRIVLSIIVFMFAMTVCAAIYEQGRAGLGLEADRG